MDAKELIKGLSDTAFEEVANAVVLEAQERNLSIPALASVGNLAVEGADSFEVVDESITVLDTPSGETKETTDTRESIFFQLAYASHGYNTVARVLGKKEVNGETLALEFNDWLTEDKLDYVIKAQEADPKLKFTLVATPNVLVTPKELAKLAKAFGEKQPYPTYIDEALYSKYTKEQLSGTDPSSKTTVFSLIPNKLDERLTGTVAAQRARLAELQATELSDLKVPSPLEAVTYWYTLRANDNKLNNSEAFDQTYIRHFDLPEKRVQDWQFVPDSCVAGSGRPDLSSSRADDDASGRVVVG